MVITEQFTAYATFMCVFRADKSIAVPALVNMRDAYIIFTDTANFIAINTIYLLTYSASVAMRRTKNRTTGSALYYTIGTNYFAACRAYVTFIITYGTY